MGVKKRVSSRYIQIRIRAWAVVVGCLSFTSSLNQGSSQSDPARLRSPEEHRRKRKMKEGSKDEEGGKGGEDPMVSLRVQI